MRIDDKALENLSSNLLSVEVDSCSLFFLLTCVFSVFPSEVNGLLSSQHGQGVMDAFPSPRFLAAWRVEAPFSAVSQFDGASLSRSVSLHVIETCSEENLPDECIRPCGNETGLFFTALWATTKPFYLGSGDSAGPKCRPDLLEGSTD